MEAKETNFLRFLSSPKQLVVPIYQRTYSWKIKECEQLWDDIAQAGEQENSPSYFIGSIVYVERGLYQVSSLPKLLVIDGQQRLTTLTLLLSALRDHIKETKKETGINPEKIQSYYLLNEKESGEEKYKVILTQTDKNSLFKVLNNIEIGDEDSARIKENYQFFRKKIQTVNVNSIYKGIEKLIIIDVSLDREKDNPQLIFESLNSTGLELTHADLIRNYLLMGLEKTKQEEIYNNYWHPMERGFGHSEQSDLFDHFIRDYLTIKLGRIPNIREIYSDFKFYSSKISNIEEIVSDIYQYSKYFVNIALDKEPDSEIRKALFEINELKVDVSYPFLLNAYNDYTQGRINKKELIEILELIESYVFRRAICGVPTNSLNKTFSTLYKRIDQQNYLNSLNAILAAEDSYRRLPTDEEFMRELVIKDVYNSRIRNYILRKLENYGRKELVNVDSYTIEHIMPQNPQLPGEWKKELGENWKEIQKNYLHTIGNLTLTGYNSELSDNPFKTKQNLPGGFRDSPIRLNRELANQTKWGENEIKNRGQEIATLAKEIWAYPIVSKEWLEKYKEKDNIETTKQKYTIEDHPHLKQGEPMRPIFEELRKRILNIDSSVREEPLKQYIAYKSITNFVDIITQKKALRLSLNIPIEKVKDPLAKCKDVSETGRWGNGDIEIKITAADEIDYAMSMIKQAFDNVIGEDETN